MYLISFQDFFKTKFCWFYQKKVVVYSKSFKYLGFKKVFINESSITGGLEMKKNSKKPHKYKKMSSKTNS